MSASTDRTFLSGGGELGRLISDFDWRSTPLGPIAGWPQSLKTTVGLILRSPVPIVTLWGDDGIMIYNDAYSVFAGGRHPELLGSKVREGWAEIADFNDNVMKVGLSGGTLAYKDQELTLHRNGVPEPVWMNLDYSPVPGESGAPAGVIAIVVETTAKVLAERWLTGERERLRLLFEQAPGFIAMLSGPDHVFELANPAYSQLIGHREVLGLPIASALPELAGQGFFELLDGVYASGEAFAGTAVPVTLQRMPGAPVEERHVDFVYQPVRDASGAVTGIFAQGMDVSERVEAEQALHASEMQFRTVAQAMPNHVWASPPNGQLDWFNERVYSYSGTKLGELDGQKWAEIVHPDDVPAAAERWAAALESGERYETEFRLRRADGVYRWHIARALPIRSPSGEITRWVGTNTDIEDQKTATRMLATLNETLERQVAERTAERDRMWRLSTDIMLVTDFAATIVATNPAWTLNFGWSEADLAGRRFVDIIHPDDQAPTLAEIAKLREGAATLRFENRCRRKDGSYCTLAWAAGADEQFVHAVGRDVTAERDAAEALRRSEAALRQAQKMEAVGRLTGGIAHDFNNLLQVISGNLQLLAKEAVGNERAERRVANALAGVGRGAKLASQLLAFGRRQALEPKVVNIGRFVAAMDEMLRRTLGEAIEIETVVSGGLWNTFIDPAQVENALLNLAINARDAMEDQGKLTIEVGNAFLDDSYAYRHPEVTAGQYVALAVTDTGCGMTAETMAQVFEPFFSTKPEGKGTGLGLSMVYGFVKQSGGHVKIYSEVGQGTTIKLYLPRALAPEDVELPASNAAVSGGNETILVVEDDDEVRGTVVEMLGDLGYRVLKAVDAQSALSVIESGAPIDLLFTDVVMPGSLKSPEMARRARERLPNLAVLFTSGYTENSIVHGGRLDPGLELLSKPYSREALARKVRQVLANRQPATPASDGARLAAAPAGATSPSAEPPRHARTVLLVEDEILIRMNTADMLQEAGHVVVEADNAKEALAALETSAIDVLVTDVNLPGMAGPLLADEARKRKPSIAIVFATGNSHVDGAEESGAVLLRKPYDAVALEQAIADACARSGDGGSQ